MITLIFGAALVPDDDKQWGQKGRKDQMDTESVSIFSVTGNQCAIGTPKSVTFFQMTSVWMCDNLIRQPESDYQTVLSIWKRQGSRCRCVCLMNQSAPSRHHYTLRLLSIFIRDVLSVTQSSPLRSLLSRLFTCACPHNWLVGAIIASPPVNSKLLAYADLFILKKLIENC